MDSILFYYYLTNAYPHPTSASYYGEIIPGFTQDDEGFTLIKSSSDGLTDTLKYHLPRYSSAKVADYVKKYSIDGKLISSSWDEYSNVGERKYIYDAKNRISEIITIKNSDGAATVMVYDTIKFDYEYNLYFTGEGIENNTIYTKNDTLFVFYSDEGYEILDDDESIYNKKMTQYIFDVQNRLIKIIASYLHPTPTSGEESDTKVDTIIEYKYTNSGYEEYLNDMKIAEYKFQNDGYCMEINRYEQEVTDYLPLGALKTIEKYSYFKNGEIIVDNGLIESDAPKVQGKQGGITVITEKSLPVSIYTFSGGLVKQERVSAGTNTIPMTKGLYVVAIGSMSYKILVQ